MSPSFSTVVKYYVKTMFLFNTFEGLSTSQHAFVFTMLTEPASVAIGERGCGCSPSVAFDEDRRLTMWLVGASWRSLRTKAVQCKGEDMP